MAGLSGMPDRIRIIPHEAVPLCGSFEVRFRYETGTGSRPVFQTASLVESM
jgi:hypothetical protein